MCPLLSRRFQCLLLPPLDLAVIPGQNSPDPLSGCSDNRSTSVGSWVHLFDALTLENARLIPTLFLTLFSSLRKANTTWSALFNSFSSRDNNQVNPFTPGSRDLEFSGLGWHLTLLQHPFCDLMLPKAALLADFLYNLELRFLAETELRWYSLLPELSHIRIVGS